MLDENALGPGFPEWTELGQETGLDPLGMQRPIEVVYQSLLPGISTITLRLRYYSFFPWLLDSYARRNGSTDMQEFRFFQRKAEALYALLCAHRDYELGIAGILWASRELQSLAEEADPNAIVDFASAADPDSRQNRYLENKGGAFGGIYASQLREMGLVRVDDPNIPIPYCTNAAMDLADAMSDQLGDLAEVFLSAVEKGQVTVETLDRLALMKPSRVPADSVEQEALAAVLMGRQQNAREPDVMRRQTLIELLRLAGELQRIPRADDAKWAWFNEGNSQETDRIDVLGLWSLYQASDLCRLAYEGFLSAALQSLEATPYRRKTLREIVADLIEPTDLENTTTLAEYLRNQTGDEEPETLAKQAASELLEAEKTGDVDGEVRASIRLLSALWRKSSDYSSSVLRRLRSADHFQSYATEIRFLEQRLSTPARTAFEEMISSRVIKRHLWVASRKFRNQKAYTFLMEPDDGQLRFRSRFSVSPSSPRIDQAVQFLHDAKLLDDKGPTSLGLAEIERQ